VVAVRQHLGREPLQTDVGKTDRRHRAAQIHRTTGGNGQRCKPPVRLQQSQIIGRISASFNFKRVNAKFSPNNAHVLKAVLFQGLSNVIFVE
jgi:sensor histidine kinase regulating citrate/malate metabolism